MARATASEQAFLRALVLGDIRQGALAAVVGDAVAKAADVPLDGVRRALMLRGDLGAVAAVALGGRGSRRSSGSRSGGRSPRCWPRPRRTSTAALEKTGPAAVEWKLDGARIQVHRSGDEVGDLHAHAGRRHRAASRRWSRRRWRCRRASFVLDGEAIALARGRAAAPVPGHREPVREQVGRAAHADVLRPPAPRRRGPARPAGIGAGGGAGRAGPGARGGCRAAGPSSSRSRSRRGTRASS